MKYKKIIVLAIFLVSLLAVSTVSAADNATSDVVSVEETTVDIVKETADEVVSVENDNQTEDLGATQQEDVLQIDDGTFTALQNKINNATPGSTITLENDYYYNEGFSTDGIIITKNLTINGNGHIINGLSKSRIFSLSYDTVKYGSSDDFTLTLNKINFLNGYSTGDGGAIKSVSGVKYGVKLTNSYWYSWDLDITDCIFNNNMAAGLNGSTGMGGAIDTRGKLTIKDSTFSNNEAKNYGGAIYSGTYDFYGNMECYNCIFTNNKVKGYGGGGALNIYGDADFNGCSFTSNEVSSDSGGAVYTSGDIEINRSTFRDNKAESGGAIFTFSGKANINYCNFTSNEASKNGGAVYSVEHQTIKNCEFISNIAAEDGGAVYYDGKVTHYSSSSQTVTIYTNLIETSYFKDNAADNNGGAICSNSGTYAGEEYGGYAEKCTFEKNKAPNGNDVYGTTTVDCIFKGNVVIDAADLVKYYGGSEKFLVKVTDDGKALSNVNVKITANGKTSTVATDSNGQASINLNLPVGTYDVVSEYDGIKATSKITVKSTLTTSDVAGVYLNSKVTATFLNTNGKPLANTKVNFKIGTATYSATTDSNGVATANIPLNVGNYTVTAVNPSSKEEKQFKLTIDKANVKMYYSVVQNRNSAIITFTMNPTETKGYVYYSFDGTLLYRVEIGNGGKATLNLTDLNPGSYKIFVGYMDSEKNFNSIPPTNEVTFTISESLPELIVDDLTKTYGSSSNLVVNLVDGRGNAIANAIVNVNIKDKVTPITTDSNGQATMSINKAPGAYTAIITYLDAQTTVQIKVKKATPKMTAKAKAFKKSVKTKKYIITLKTNTNKVMKNTKVTLKVNGKTYKATTNTKGQATFKITKLTKKGKFTAVVKYAGNKYYNAKTAKPKITVK